MDYRYQKDFPNGLKDVLLSNEQFRPLPKYEDEAVWQSVSEEARKLILQKAEGLLTAPMPRSTATRYMKYFRTGERDYDGSIDYPMRQAMFWLTAAECLEREGRFVDTLIDYIWALCETTSWCLPAHNWQGMEGGWNNSGTRPLPDIKDPQIDLFAATTGEYMAWTLYIMRGKLDEVTYLISERIEYELNRRIVEPFCNRRDAWWVSDSTHNWHMWITANCLSVVLLTETNSAKRAKAVELALRYTEEFYRSYLADGSTNEGPGYWVCAGGSMYYALKMLKLVSNGRIDHFNETMVRNIASYIYRIHINNTEFYNYSYNGRYVGGIQGVEICDFGRQMQDPAMMAWGAYMYRLHKRPFSLGEHAFIAFFEMLHCEELADIPAKAPYVGYYYSHAQQLMIARERPGAQEGFFLGAKGFNGHFDSHRDGGTFVLYRDCKPVYIEIGSPKYSREVIDARYRHYHFNCLPQSHNAITVNGMGQKPGTLVGAMSRAKQESAEAAAISSRSTSTDDGVTAALTVNMGHLFPEESGVLICERTFALDRAAGIVTIHQKVECDRESDICLHFLTCEKPEENGEILVGGTKLTYDRTLFIPKVERFDYENDPKIRSTWGEELYRVTLMAQTKLLDTVITISKE